MLWIEANISNNPIDNYIPLLPHEEWQYNKLQHRPGNQLFANSTLQTLEAIWGIM